MGESEALTKTPKSGMAVMVQCGGTLAKACFPGWHWCFRLSIIGPPFLVRGAREGIGNALIFQGSLKDAPPAARRDLYVVLEAVGGAHREHQEHLPCAQGGFWRRLGNSLESSDLEESINGPKEGEKEPNCADDAPVRRVRARARARARRTPTSYAQWHTCFLRSCILMSSIIFPKSGVPT